MQKSLVYVFPASFVLAAALSAVPAFAREQPLPSEDAGSALSQDQAEQAGKPQAGPQGMPPQGGRPKSVFDGDWVTIGMGAGYRPSYEGSDDYNIGPAPLIQGSVSGFEFGARGPGLYVDLVRDSDSKSNIKFAAGPQILARLDRNGRIKDDVVEALGKRDVAIELGFTAGVVGIIHIAAFDRAKP